MKTVALYVALGSLCQRYRLLSRQYATGAADMAEHCYDEARRLVREYLPSGGGFDSGTELVIDVSGSKELVFKTAFHHMDDSGTYDGWTDHKVRVQAEFSGIDVYVGGRDRDSIKEHISDAFHQALCQMVSYEEVPKPCAT